MTFRTTAEPTPCIAMAKPASEGRTSSWVRRRYIKAAAEGGAAWHNVADRKGRQVDLHDASTKQDSWGENRVGEHRPGNQSSGLEDGAGQGHPDIDM